MSKFKQIAIDGVSGSGKSIISNLLAQKINFLYINTGIFFRGIAFLANHQNKTNFDDLIKEIKKNKLLIFKDNKVFFENKEIYYELFSTCTTSRLSEVAKNKSVRNYILELEKDYSQNHNVVMEGRDIGSVVFPNAFLKIFLNASIEIRAHRRYEQLKKNNQLENIKIEELTENIRKRDESDFSRKISPLKKCEDAIEINTDDLTIEDVVEKIYQIYIKKLNNN